ncbi:chorismate synthase [Hathewaya limosa]|uniref:Chorismate synthase n=1 Tax=Hathewaya limosa TaxID=1536 RepID=A0ABU0JTP8_HATLI|nr:chorismate synthase [Hathewaya limosa]MDQ0480467.1 chorismate synthase [Hathewaya limosa]
MSSVWGNKLKLSIFGESHGEGIGVVIDGLPAGIKLDLDYINKEMQRRAPGKSKLATGRCESDLYNILSGYFDGKTTGTPLCATILNKDKRSKDYSKFKTHMRPSHGDYTGFLKYSGFNDYRGGGHFSGRITAPLVFAGAIAMQILEKHKKIFIGSHIKSIYTIEEEEFSLTDVTKEQLKNLRNSDFPVLCNEVGEKMKNEILKAKHDGDSVGGVVECTAINIEGGFGEPFFDSIESRLSHILFSIPAVKGIEFGKGFNISKLKGSNANDCYYINEGKILTKTNNNGGVLGGITNGMPLNFKVCIKPTPSISKVQNTVDISKMEQSQLVIEGRHDPCIVPRAIPVVESAVAITILDFILEREGELWIKN